MTRSGTPAAATAVRSKPAKLLHSIHRWRKAITIMSEHKQGYMAALDSWTQEMILDPVYEAWRDVERAPEEFCEECQQQLNVVVADAKRAIREKVLESYRNGQKAP